MIYNQIEDCIHRFALRPSLIWMLILLLSPFKVLAYQDSTDVKIDAAIKGFNHILKYGTYSKTDSLLSVFEAFSKYETLDRKNELQVEIYKARLYVNKRKFGTALSHVENASILIKKQNQNLPEIQQVIDYYLMYLPIQVSRKLNPEATKNYFDKYKNREDLDPFMRGLAFEYMARVNQDLGKYEASLNNINQAISIFKAIDYQANIRIAYTILGATYDLVEDFNKAAESYEKSLTYGNEPKEPNYDVLATTSYNLSLMYGDRLGDSKKGAEFAQLAIEYDTASGGKANPYLALDYQRLADCYLNLLEFSKAEIYAEKAVDHAKIYFKKRPNNIASSLSTLSKVYAVTNRLELALDKALEGTELIEKVVPENHRWRASQYLNLAEIYSKMENDEAAKKYYHRTIAIAKQINRDLFLITAYDGLIQSAFKSKKLAELPELLNQLEIILNDRFKNAKSRHLRLKLYRLTYYRLKNDKENSELLINELIEDQELHSFPELHITFQLETLLAKKTTSVEDYQDFLKNLVESRNKYPNPFNKVNWGNKLRSTIDYVLNDIFDAYKESGDKDYLNTFFSFLELNKNAVLLEGLENVPLKKMAGIASEIIEMEDDLMDSIRTNKRKIQNLSQSKSESNLQGLYDKQLVFETKYDSLQRQLNQEHPELLQAKYIHSSQSIIDYSKNNLARNQSIIEYFIGENYWYRLSIIKGEIELERFNDVKGLNTEIHKLRNSILNQSFDYDLSQNLYKKLLPDLPSPAEQITFITDGSLSLLPLESLVINDQFLIESFSVSYAGSLSLLRHQEKMFSKGKRWLGFAPKYAINELPGAREEITSIEKMTNGTAFLDDTATKSNFLKESPKFNILHLAAHAEIDQNNPMQNTIIFSKNDKDELLTASEIYSLGLKANLAVLSSCNTGFGKIEKGEGVMSLSRAFAYAGVSSTVMTLWQIPDTESSQITTAFYKALEDGMPKNEALQFAKLEYLTTTEDMALREPYYWAGFILSGNTSAVNNSGDLNNIILAGSVIFFVGLIVFLYRKFQKS
ncbi:MAG: CHAT domain-containing tetratricopeptide repeat protein [Bacteroidota bacterium]